MQARTCSGFCLHTGCGWLLSGEQREEKGRVRVGGGGDTLGKPGAPDLFASVSALAATGGREPAPHRCPWPDWASASPLLRSPSSVSGGPPALDVVPPFFIVSAAQHFPQSNETPRNHTH